MQIGRPITFDWDGKFLEAEETIEKYDIYLSTFPGGLFIQQTPLDCKPVNCKIRIIAKKA